MPRFDSYLQGTPLRRCPVSSILLHISIVEFRLRMALLAATLSHRASIRPFFEPGLAAFHFALKPMSGNCCRCPLPPLPCRAAGRYGGFAVGFCSLSLQTRGHFILFHGRIIALASGGFSPGRWFLCRLRLGAGPWTYLFWAQVAKTTSDLAYVTSFVRSVPQLWYL